MNSHKAIQTVGTISDYAIYMLDARGMVTSWNPGAIRFEGYRAEEVIGRHFSVFYTDEDRLSDQPAMALETAAKEGRFERESWQVRKDGSRFWATVVIDAIRSPDGELVGFAKITRDLTERRESEAALERSEEQFRLLVQGVTDYAIYMLDKDGHVASWNAGAERIKGYAREEIIGEHFSRFYTELDQKARVPWTGLRLAREEGRWESEGQRVRKDGTTFWAHVVIDAIRDDDGELLGYAKITQDITERRAAQAELERAQEALFQSQKLEALGQLTGGIAHDFNNLLMAAMSGLELLRRRLPKDPRLSQLLDSTLEALKRGSALTDRMLAFARRQELKLDAVEVGAVVRSMHSFLQRSIGPSVQIKTEIPDALPAAYTDPNQLETVVLNLLLNARDAVPAGGVITIAAKLSPGSTAEPRLTEGDYIVLSVSDTGMGMDAQTLSRATEPFFSTKGIGKGTGLGLSMVHGLALQSRGALNIRSRVGHGTVVELWLPIAPVAAAPSMSPTNAPIARTSHFVILLVDDDPLVLGSTASLLEDLGHFVLTAASGPEAVNLAKHHLGINAVITDFAMPAMNGLELAKALRRDNPDLPIIVATGYADAPIPDEEQLFRLKKPFTQEQLQDTLLGAVGPE